MDLYITQPEYQEKSASEVSLPEDANAWPNEIMQELYKQVSYIADFDPQVVMDKVDAERGYGFGHVEVQNRSEMTQGATAEQKKQVGVSMVRIPIIISERKLQPFDVLITSAGKALPLSEGRLRQALFRPQAFDVTGKTPGDMSMVGQLYPPYRQNSGFGGVASGVMGKESAAKTASDPEFAAKVEKVLGIKSEPKKDELKSPQKTARAASTPSGHASYHIADKLEAAHRQASDDKTRSAAAAELRRFDAWEGSGDHTKYDKKWDAHLPKTASPSGVPNGTSPAPGHNIKGIVPNMRQVMSKSASLLQAILPTISTSDYVAFTDHFSDKGLQAAFMKNAHATEKAVRTLLEFEPRAEDKTAAILDAITPTVAQIRKETEGYSLKLASHQAWQPVVRQVDRGEVVRSFGEKVALAADLSGSVTLAEGEGAKASPEENRCELISGFGYYKAQTTDGEEVAGFAFPNLYDLDGSALPITLFVDEAHATLQESVAGERITNDVPELPLSGGPPSGHGCFVRRLEGSAEATIPVTVHAGYQSGGAQQFQAETYDGRSVMISVQEGGALRIPQQIDDTCVIPADFEWLPLGDSEELELVAKPEDWGQQKQASRELGSITVRAGGDDSFSFDGTALRKIAQSDKSFMSIDDALFLLGGLGTDLTYAAEKLAEAIVSHAPVTVRIGRAITLASDATQKWAAGYDYEKTAIISLRRDLVKEAAFVPDPVAVDTVLSLGFINPENLQTFVQYLPKIDEVQAKLCELLVATRLGLSDVPVSALEKTVRSLEEVIDGLKVIAFQKS